MERGRRDLGTAVRHVRGFGLRLGQWQRHDLLRRDGSFRRRRDANPAVFDAEAGRIAMLDVLLRALDRRHQDEYERERSDGDASRQTRHRVRHVLYRPSHASRN